MRLRKWQALLAGAVLLLALPVAAACGGDDDDDAPEAATATEEAAVDETEVAADETEVAPATTEATEATDATAEATSEGDATATVPEDDGAEEPLPDVDIDDDDRTYASALCGAFSDFYGDFENAFLQVTPDEDTDPLEGFLGVFQGLRDAIEDINPPGRYVEFHQQALAVYNQLVDDLESGNPEPLAGVEVPDPPLELQARISEAADEDPVCQQVEEDFGTELFGTE